MGGWLLRNVQSLRTKFGKFREKLEERVKASGPAAHDLLPICVEAVEEVGFLQDVQIRGWVALSCLCLNSWFCAGWDRADHLEHPRDLAGSQKDFLHYHLQPAFDRMLEGEAKVPGNPRSIVLKQHHARSIHYQCQVVITNPEAD